MAPKEEIILVFKSIPLKHLDPPYENKLCALLNKKRLISIGNAKIEKDIDKLPNYIFNWENISDYIPIEIPGYFYGPTWRLPDYRAAEKLNTLSCTLTIDEQKEALEFLNKNLVFGEESESKFSNCIVFNFPKNYPKSFFQKLKEIFL